MNASSYKIYQRLRENGVHDLKARSMARTINMLLKDTQVNKNKFTTNDIALMLKDAIAEQAST
jgi:hypothetical protein